MNRPIIVSTPDSSGGRPATVTPKTTSDRPLYRPSSSAQAPWIRVPSVSRRDRASVRERAVEIPRHRSLALGDSDVPSDAVRARATPSSPSGVGSVSPARARRQCPRPRHRPGPGARRRSRGTAGRCSRAPRRGGSPRRCRGPRAAGSRGTSRRSRRGGRSRSAGAARGRSG